MSLKRVFIVSVLGLVMGQSQARYVNATPENFSALLEQLKEAIRVRNGVIIADMYLESFCNPVGRPHEVNEMKHAAHREISKLTDHRAIMVFITKVHEKNWYALNDVCHAVYRGTRYQQEIEKLIGCTYRSEKRAEEQKQDQRQQESVYPRLDAEQGNAQKVPEKLLSEAKQEGMPPLQTIVIGAILGACVLAAVS